MKKIAWFVCITLLFFACKHKDKTQEALEASKRTLYIQNQSSVPIKSVKFSGATFAGKNADDFVLDIAEKGKIKLEDISTGYVYFSIIDSKNKTEIKVRSNEVVSVEEDETNIFVVTDNTLVLPIGSTVKSTVLGIVMPARLKVSNNSSCSIEDIFFSGRNKKEGLSQGEVWQTDFSNEVFGTLSFKLVSLQNKKSIDVSIEQKMRIKVGDVKEVELNNASLVLCEGKVRTIGSILGVSAISIINSSSAEISNLKFAGQSRIQSLKKGEVWQLGSHEDVNEALSFEVKTKDRTFSLKTDDNIACRMGEVKSFVITDDTVLDFSEYERPIKLGTLLDASIVTISNKSSVELLTLSYSDTEFANIAHDESKTKLVWNAQSIARPISFSVYQQTSGSTVIVTTKERFLCQKGEKQTIEIVDSTFVVPEGSLEGLELEKLPFAARLKIVNNTTAKLLNVNYADASFGAINTYSEKTFVFLKNTPTKKVISFEVSTEDGLITLQTKDEISLVRGKTISYAIERNSIVVRKDTGESDQIRNILKLGILNIVNKTGKNLRDLKIAEKTYDAVLGNSETWKIEFKDEMQGLLKFTLVTNVHTVSVITKEKIILAKGDEKTFSISDDTLVTVQGDYNPIRMQELLNACALNIVNDSSKELLNVEYDSFKFDKINPNDEKNITKIGDLSLRVQITFEIKTKDKKVKLKTKEYVLMEAGRITTYRITDYTPLIIKDSNDETVIKNFIEKCILKVVNKSSLWINYCKYAGREVVNCDTYNIDHSLKNDEIGQYEYEDEAEDYLHFTLCTPSFALGDWLHNILRTKATFSLVKGKVTTVVITDDTEVRYEGGYSGLEFPKEVNKIADVVDVAKISITNYTYKPLFDVKFHDLCEIGDVDKFSNKDRIFYNFPKTPGSISFSLEDDAKKQRISVKTKELISLIKWKTVDYKIKSKTIVIREDTGEELLLGALIKQLYGE